MTEKLSQSLVGHTITFPEDCVTPSACIRATRNNDLMGKLSKPAFGDITVNARSQVLHVLEDLTQNLCNEPRCNLQVRAHHHFAR